MSSSSVEQIKEKLEVSDVIGSYIKLEKAGANFKGKCPFHNEKTPSFFVSPGRGSYYCFGCGAKGDIFTFVQEFEGLDFVGSLKLLAERAGVVLDNTPRSDTSEKERLFSVLEMATLFFEKNLTESKEAKAYLTKRGLQDEIIALWRVGFIPKDWRLLYAHLKAQGVSETDMEKVGLIKKTDKAGSGEMAYYDVFRGRIMFPIFDVSGRVVAFSGRILEEDPKAPKYLNSPETALFNKSETLYGLDKAKLDIRKKDYSILVEGQLDILMCHQAGFSNTVASSGTAFTSEHLQKLQRLSNRLTLAFDSDKAGFTAANKSAVLALSLGMEVKIVEMPKGTDPAELILHDIDSFKEALRGSKHLIDFYLDSLMAEGHDKRVLAKEVEKKVLPYIAMLGSAIEQSHFISQVSKKTGIREDAIWNDLRKIPRGVPNSVTESVTQSVDKEVRHRKSYLERRLAGIIWWRDGLPDNTLDTTKLRVRLVSIAGDVYVSEMFASLEKHKEELIFEAESYYDSVQKLERDLDELLINFEEDILRERFVVSMNELQKAEDAKDEKRSAELLATCQTISVQLAELSKRRQSLEVQ